MRLPSSSDAMMREPRVSVGPAYLVLIAFMFILPVFNVLAARFDHSDLTLPPAWPGFKVTHRKSSRHVQDHNKPACVYVLAVPPMKAKNGNTVQSPFAVPTPLAVSVPSTQSVEDHWACYR